MSWEVTITGNRGDEWRRAVGTATFPVTSELPEMAAVFQAHCLVYFLDAQRLDARTREKVEAYIAEKFRLSRDQVHYMIDYEGCPILAKDLITPHGHQI